MTAGHLRVIGPEDRAPYRSRLAYGPESRRAARDFLPVAAARLFPDAGGPCPVREVTDAVSLDDMAAHVGGLRAVLRVGPPGGGAVGLLPSRDRVPDGTKSHGRRHRGFQS